MIPNNIKKNHLLQAIDEIDTNGVPPHQQSTRYDLLLKGRRYPPKLVVRIANRLVNGHELWYFGGGKETNDFLEKHQFAIVPKDSDMSAAEEKAIEYNEWALQQLLEYHQAHPDFYFHTRTNKKLELLEAGHWFPGTDYVHIGLTVSASGDHSTKSVGFNIHCVNPDRPEATFNILFRKENRPEVIAFYHKFFDLLQPFGMQKIHADNFILSYGSDIEAAMKLFLERDWPIFQSLLQQEGMVETLGISKGSFRNKLQNVLSIRGGANLPENRIARLCWNTNGWVMPSGKAGKSDNKESFENWHGLGFEEWLLDMDKVLDDGYHYGFLQPVNQEWQAYAGNTYQVKLYTWDKANHQRYWVGELTDVAVIDQDQSDAVEAAYRKKGWLDEMAEQLDQLGINRDYLSKNRPKEVGALFNVRFLPENVKVYEPLIPFSSQESDSMTNNRYVFLKAEAMGQNSSQEPLPFVFAPSAPPPDLKAVIKRRSEHREMEHRNKHAEIQQGLYNWLLQQQQPPLVSWEQGTGNGGSRIDIAVQTGPDRYIFYEVKTYNSLMTCIRVAFGQLVEYSYFPERCLAERMVIVSYHKPEAPTMHYLEHIRNITGLPLYYEYFDVKTGKLSGQGGGI